MPPLAAHVCCPTCSSPFRRTRICPRCGSDLGEFMTLIVAATRLRNAARQALQDGDARDAVERASASLELHATPAGLELLAMARLCLAATTAHGPQVSW